MAEQPRQGLGEQWEKTPGIGNPVPSLAEQGIDKNVKLDLCAELCVCSHRLHRPLHDGFILHASKFRQARLKVPITPDPLECPKWPWKISHSCGQAGSDR